MVRRIGLFLLTVAALISVVATNSQAQSMMTRHMREVTRSGEAKSMGQLAPDRVMNLDIVLPLRDQAGLNSFLKELYDPASVSYRHFLTVAEFTERFGPTQQDYDAVVRFAKANGFAVVGGSRDGMDVQVRGSVSAVEDAFHVTMGSYQHPSESRTFYAPDREPTPNLPFALWHISGMDNFSLPHPLYVKRSDFAQAHGISAEAVVSHATTGSGPSASFLGSDMRAAYYGGTALNGAGQNLGLFEFLGTDLADLTTYFKNVGQTNNVPITLLSTDGTSTSCVDSRAGGSCDDTEQTLDITQAGGMAPGLTTVYLYVSNNSDTAMLSAMGTDKPLPLNLSSSWTWSPADPSSDNPLFQKFAAQGQSFFQATGDSGGYKGTAPWPANAAYVIAVGGTDLVTKSAGGPWASETAWNDGGGGFGTNVTIPTWQQLTGVITSQNGGSTTLRNVPDVSANANFTFYVCADQTTCSENEFGGTSFAAPMWAGYLALANQQAATNGVPAPGFLDPTIYPLNLGSSYTTNFHDITSGTNRVFTATTGYDLTTGWGSPNGANLINALTTPSGPSFTLAASPSSVSVTQGASGTSTITITPVGGFSSSVTLAASGLPSGVTGTFSPNPATTTSTLTLAASATATTGTSTVTITGTSGSLTATTTVSLTVTSSSSGPVVTLTPTSLAWAKVAVGVTKGPKTITVKNTGTATLVIGSVAVSGDFSLSTVAKSCEAGTNVAVGKSCVIKVSFTPTQVGTRTGDVTITDNAGNSPQQVPLSGTGK